VKIKMRSELAGLLRLGIPIIFTQLLQVSQGTIAIIMMGRVGSRELAAVGLGTSFWVFVWLGSMGLLMGLSPTIAQHKGAGRLREMRDDFQQGLWMALVIGMLAFVLMRNIGGVMDLVGVDSQVIPLVKSYLGIGSWSMPAVCVYLVMRFFCEATGNSRPMMVIQILVLPIVVLGNWVLIYGNLGFPALGVDGAALTFAGGMILAAILLSGYMLFTPRYRDLGLFDGLTFPVFARLGALFRLGVPISISLVLDSAFFNAINLLMGRFGHVALAAHQLVINFATVIFMVAVGISSAVMARVGQSVGSGNVAEVRLRGWIGIATATVLMLPSVLFMTMFPGIIASIYTSEPEVTDIAVSLLMVAALFQLFDGLYMAGAGALRGLKDVNAVMWISVLSYWVVGFPVAWILGINWGPTGLWYGMVVGIGLTAILLGWRFEIKSRKLLASHVYCS
jgi:MATE family multidrug resistance protein